MKYKIDVTAADILNGTPGDPFKDPVAIALSRTFPKAEQVANYGIFVKIDGRDYATTDFGKGWIHWFTYLYDCWWARWALLPFSFEFYEVQHELYDLRYDDTIHCLVGIKDGKLNTLLVFKKYENANKALIKARAGYPDIQFQTAGAIINRWGFLAPPPAR